MHRTDRHPFFVLAACCCAALLAGCAGAFPTVTKQAGEYRVTHPGREVNSAGDDVAPQLGPDGTALYFTSNRETRENPEGADRVYRAAHGGSSWREAQPAFSQGMARGKAGAVTFDPAHGQAIVVRCFQPDGIGDCDLYVLNFGPGEAAPRNPGTPLNNKEWDSHPTLTADGRTLYFASERFGGRGGSDLWTSTRNDDGTWTPPVNLGDAINSSADEVTPFIAGDGQTLWYASSSLPGYGGFDVFRSERKGGAWSTPVNAGQPVNSSDDDIFFVTTAGGDSSYVASKRGGYGGFDLFEIVKIAPPPPPPPPPVREPLYVRYTAKNAYTLDPLPARITIATQGEKDIALRAEQDGKVRSEVIDGREYFVNATCPGYSSGVDTFFYPLKSAGTRERTILLTPVFEAERKIYAFVVEFDFNYSNIRPKEKENLDSVVTLLSTYPNCTVVVSGHTDSVGTDMYNIHLGYNRATEVSHYVERYLVERVKKLRHKIEIRTYGKTQPVAGNGTEEGRQRNRRVEIAIIRNE